MCMTHVKCAHRIRSQQERKEDTNAAPENTNLLPRAPTRWSSAVEQLEAIRAANEARSRLESGRSWNELNSLIDRINCEQELFAKTMKRFKIWN